MFKRLTGKKCVNQKCRAFGSVLDASLNVCEECADPLSDISVVDKRAVMIAALAVALMVGGGGYVAALKIKGYLAAKTVEAIREPSLLLTDAVRAQVKDLLKETQTRGETAEAERRLDEIRRGYKIGDDDLEMLRREVRNESLEAAQETATIDLASNVGNKELVALLRSIYADGIKTSDEQAAIESLCRKHQVDRGQLIQLEQETKDRMNKSEISLKQGMLYAAQRDYKQAVKEFQYSLEVDPQSPFAWANLASAYLSLNDQKAALDACDRALRLDQRNWLAHYNLGSLYAKGGDKDHAISELTAALELITEDQTKRITKEEILSQMRIDQALNPLRTDSRFQQLLARN
jgi:tetratricopeptide (TPR) repeat protein